MSEAESRLWFALLNASCALNWAIGFIEATNPERAGYLADTCEMAEKVLKDTSAYNRD